MQLVASDSAVDFIRERGGRLYVWKQRNRCCGGATVTLAAATEPPAEIEFGRAEVEARFELYLPLALGSLPDDLQIEAHRFPRRVEAYWNGCAWVA